MNAEPDVQAALRAPVILNLWSTKDCLAGGTWPTVGHAPVGTNSIPPVEYVEMKQAGESQVIDFAGNVVRPASREDVENAPFRSMQDAEPVQ
jgi:hypothetical protein